MRTGVNSFCGERLTQARLARGLTQVALAAISNISSATISKCERGDQIPAAATLDALASAIGLPVGWFLKPMPNSIGENNAYFFRSKSIATATARQVAKVRLDWLYEISEIMEEWLEWPEVNIPDTGDSNGYYSDEEIEQIAIKCRNHWKLGNAPIDNLLKIIESVGILVSREELGYLSMDGVSHWYDKRPCMFLSSDKASAVRSRFDAAHELGHLLLHRNVAGDNWTKRYNELEAQANKFASAFLLPAETFAIEIRSPTLDDFLALKHRWRVSIGAMMMRAKQLGLVEETYMTRLWRNYSARRWKTGEPYDDQLRPEQPCLIARGIQMLMDEGGFSKPRLVDLIGLPLSDIEVICSMHKGWLSSSQPDNVIIFKKTKEIA